MKKTLLTVLMITLSATAAAKGGPGHGGGGDGGTTHPICWTAAQNAMRAIDLRNHGATRDDARRALFIPTMGQPGGTPQWIANDIIDPRLTAAYKTSGYIDPFSVSEPVFRECQVELGHAQRTEKGNAL
jgi:hypothetical protein